MTKELVFAIYTAIIGVLLFVFIFSVMRIEVRKRRRRQHFSSPFSYEPWRDIYPELAKKEEKESSIEEEDITITDEEGNTIRKYRQICAYCKQNPCNCGAEEYMFIRVKVEDET